MVWNGVSVDLSRLVGSGRHERPDLWFVVFWDVGRNPLHGTDGFWRWSSCGLCGGDSKSPSLGNLDDSGRRLKGTVIFLVFGVGEGKVRKWGLSHPLTVGISSRSRSVSI